MVLDYKFEGKSTNLGNYSELNKVNILTITTSVNSKKELRTIQG